MEPIFDRIGPTLRPNERIVMKQKWRDLLFLHWPVPPELLQPLLPPGLTIDTFEGDAYLGLVPFTMRDVRPVWAPAVPWLSHFPECNVRTYVHRGGASPGVWFFSLDAANPVAVMIARTIWKLPYFIADKGLVFETAKELLYQERPKESVRLLGISLNNLNTEVKKTVVVQLRFEF